MSNRCSSCGKLASLECGEPEEQNLDFDGVSSVNWTVRLPRLSACCGDEVKEYIFDGDVEFKHDIVQYLSDLDVEEESPAARHIVDEIAVLWYNLEATDRTQTTDRSGRPIKNARYMKSFYGISGEIVLEHEGSELGRHFISDEAPASYFENCN